MTKDEARERVARGAALLDQKRPGWEHQIDTGKLDLSQSCFCVLGQVCGNYYHVVRDADWRHLFGRSDLRLRVAEATALGFRHTGRSGTREGGRRWKTIQAEYRLLQDCWIELIADRLVPTTGDTSLPAAKILSDAPAQVERHRV
jgi:hypothetical protein